MGEIIDIRELMEETRMTRLEDEARREYLAGYLDAVAQLRSTEMELEELEADYGPSARAMTGAPGGKKTDGSDRIVRRMETKKRLSEVICRDRERAARRRDEVARVIDGLVNADQRAILRYRYINGMDIDRIAAETNFSYRQVINICNRGIQRIKPPRQAIQRIKAGLFEEHPEWADIQVKTA